MKPQVEATGYTIELVPRRESNIVETETKRREVISLLKQMHLRANKKGRPSNEERAVDNAA